MSDNERDNWIEIASIDLGEEPTSMLSQAITDLHRALDDMYTVSLKGPDGGLIARRVKYGQGYGNYVTFKRHRTQEELDLLADERIKTEASNARYAAKREENTKKAADELGITVEEFERVRKIANGY
jgi:hypothetical protein